jgi:methylmalonyl-CoA mutase cobalamin-binding domain/chain
MMADGGLAGALADLQEERVLAHVTAALAAGAAPQSLLEQLRRGMVEVGRRFAAGEYFLVDMIMAAEIFRQALVPIEPLLVGEGAPPLGEVVFATVRGDIHDLGKNIVVTMLRGAGFRVHDLGVDVPPERIVAAVRETGARVVGLSGLLTTAFEGMKVTVEALAQAGLRSHVRVMIGGGPVNEAVRAYAGADAWGKDVVEAAALCRRFSAASSPR